MSTPTPPTAPIEAKAGAKPEAKAEAKSPTPATTPVSKPAPALATAQASTPAPVSAPSSASAPVKALATSTRHTIEYVPIKCLVDSPFQRPRVSERGNLEELAASMRNGTGVLEPLIARVAPRGAPKGTREIVAGHRRKRAAALADLFEVPCIVRELTDVEVLDLQTIENGQREGLHPLDEADHYALSIKHGRSVVELADKNGRDRSYIAKRLKLLDLVPACRKAYEEDKLTLGAAIALARVPQTLQADALEALLAGSQLYLADKGAPVSERKARELIVSRFMLQLDHAQWALNDDELVPEAGACTTCTKRTGNQSELFDDVAHDLCTDPGCYRDKSKAVFQIRAKEADERGQKVLSEKEAKNALKFGAGFVRVDEKRLDPATGALRKVADVVKKAQAPTVLAQDPETGAPIELVREADFDKAVASTSTKGKAALAASGGDGAPVAKGGVTLEQKQRREQRRNKRVIELVLEEAIPAAEKLRGMPQSKGMWVLIAAVFRGFIEAVWSEVLTKVLQRRDPDASSGDAEKKLLALFDKSTPAEQLGIAAEVVLMKWSPKPNQRAQWSGVLAVLGVDIAKIEKQVTAEEKERIAKERERDKRKAEKKAKGKGDKVAGAKPDAKSDAKSDAKRDAKPVKGGGKLAAKVAAKKKAAQP